MNGRPASPAPADGVDAAFEVRFVHRLRFTRGVFDVGNATLRDVLAAKPRSTGRAVVFVDGGVAGAWPDITGAIEGYAEAHRDVLSLVLPIHVVPGGEAAKNDRAIADDVSAVIADAGLCRHSTVMAIGGGAMLDVVGFAAGTAHRGVRLIRFPTTTLAQGDAGIGVKNAINSFGKKNFTGTFAVPWAVINDDRFLTTLSDRDWRAGLSEAVKVALLKDAGFFRRIADAAPRLTARDGAAAGPIIRRSAELHFEHIVKGGDPFELDGARPLDFGHWSAHKLEQLSDYRLRHGEAVAIGVALDVMYSMLSGRLAEDEADEILACLTGLGLVLYDDALSEPAALLDGLEEFREHLGGRLTITLLEGIGRPVDVNEIDLGRMRAAIDRLAVPGAARRA